MLAERNKEDAIFRCILRIRNTHTHTDRHVHTEASVVTLWHFVQKLTIRLRFSFPSQGTFLHDEQAVFARTIARPDREVPPVVDIFLFCASQGISCRTIPRGQRKRIFPRARRAFPFSWRVISLEIHSTLSHTFRNQVSLSELIPMRSTSCPFPRFNQLGQTYSASRFLRTLIRRSICILYVYIEYK